MEQNSGQKKSTVSEAQLKANRFNARLSTGPSPQGRTRTCFNAVKHGLTARVAWQGQDPARDEQFFRLAWEQIGPRNAIEEMCLANLLGARLREYLLIETEQKVLTRKPVCVVGSSGDQPFQVLQDPVALTTLDRLARHLTHLSNAAEKGFLSLLGARQDGWPETSPSAADSKAPNRAPAPTSDGGSGPTGTVTTTETPEGPGSLEDCLEDRRLILSGEDEHAYEALARGLWATFKPLSVLEGFLVTDVIQTQWRLDRIFSLQRLVLERQSSSTTHHNCGLAFGFIQDSQRLSAMEPLRQYEGALRKRLEKRLVLVRRVRKENWKDSPRSNHTAPAQPASTPAGASPLPAETPTAPFPANEQSQGDNRPAPAAAPLSAPEPLPVRGEAIPETNRLASATHTTGLLPLRQ